MHYCVDVKLKSNILIEEMDSGGFFILLTRGSETFSAGPHLWVKSYFEIRARYASLFFPVFVLVPPALSDVGVDSPLI